MEDLFQIIFILIFILSSIASSLSKKKKRKNQNQKNQPQRRQPDPVRKVRNEPVTAKKKEEKTTSQILEEMLGLKIDLPEPRIPEVPVDYSENTIEHKTWDPAKEYAEVETEGVSDYRDKVSVKKSEILNARKKHTAFHKENNIDLQQVVEASGISKLFSKEANLKDYIKVQEILNKPKALRR